MKNRSRLQNFLLSITPVVAALLIMNALSFMLMEALIAYDAYTGAADSLTDMFSYMLDEQILSADYNILLMLLYSIVGSVLYYVWYRRFLKEGNQDLSVDRMRRGTTEAAETEAPPENTLRSYSPLLYIGILLVAAGCLIVITDLVNVMAIAFPDWLVEYEQIMESSGITGDEASFPALALLYAIILGPIAEELCFRGLCFGYARRALSFWGAVAVQAILFAGFHGNALQGAYTLLFGFVLGYIYGRCRNIGVTILLHILYNGLNFLAEEFLPGDASPVVFFLALLGSLLAVYLGIKVIIRSIPGEVNAYYAPARPERRAEGGNV